MIRDDTELAAVNCPHEECENRQNALVPAGSTVIGETADNDDRSEATGKVRVDCDGHRFYVHFVE